MMTKSRTLVSSRIVLLSLAAVCAVVFSMLLSSGRTFAASVAPVEVGGNPPCPAGTIELKVEPVASGTYSDGTLTVTISVYDTASGQAFDFTANIGVDVVIAKGGNAGNVYTYPAETTGDTGLHAPVNASGGYAGLSHISFCYDIETPTNTPEIPTETPTEVIVTETPTEAIVTETPPSEVTETVAVTETIGGQEETPVSTSTTAPSQPTATTAPVEELPNTGAAPGSDGTSSLVAAGLFAVVLAAAGLVLRRKSVAGR